MLVVGIRPGDSSVVILSIRIMNLLEHIYTGFTSKLSVPSYLNQGVRFTLLDPAIAGFEHVLDSFLTSSTETPELD